MPVKIFIPKIPQNEDEFINFIKKLCNPSNIRIAKNKDGSFFCVISLNYSENDKCANDLIKEISGKVIGDILMKPRIYVDQSMICKLSNPLVNSKDDYDDVVNTTHFHDGYYYVQLLSEKDTNTLMSSNLRDLHNDFKCGKVLPMKYADIEVGTLYATYYSDDNHLYRVRITGKLNNTEVKAEFVDFGNEEVISNQYIFPISNKLAGFVPMVHKCVITDVKIKSSTKQEYLAREILHRNYRAKLVKRRDETLNCDRVVSLDYVDFTTVSYRSYLIIEDIADEIQYNGCKPECRNGLKEEASVVITHFESLDEFYVQPANTIINENLSFLSNAIADFVETIRPEDTYIGQDVLYVSQFTQDNNWYRCRIVEDRFNGVEGNCLVQFIDFGNFELKWNREDLKPLVDKEDSSVAELIKIPACARKCKFSDDLIYALSKAKMEKEYFLQNFVRSEKVVSFQYDFDQSSKIWIVENIVMPNHEEIISIVMKQCENTEKTDIYRLTNLESLQKLWFRLVKSVNPAVQEHVATIEQWTKEQNFRDLQPVKQILLNQPYCAKMPNGYPIRCTVIAKNKSSVIIQSIDGGNYESVPIDSIFALNPSVVAVPSLAHPYRLGLNICTDEHQIEEKIIQILGNSNVELVLLDDKSIRDVIIKEKSLVKCLALLDYIEPANRSNHMLDFKETNNEETDPDEGVDFTLPSVEKMAEVPLEIAIYNSHVRIMRKLFSIHTTNLFKDLFQVIDQCDKINNLLECCNEVDNLSNSIDALNLEFTCMTTDIRTKLKDLDPAIDKRKALCESICRLYTNLTGLLESETMSNLELLRVFIGSNFVTVKNLLQIFKISIDKCSISDPAAADNIDIKTTQKSILEFQSSELHANLVKQFTEKAQVTDELVNKYKSMLESMYKDYELGQALPNAQSTGIPLIDSTYELHNALKSETQHFLGTFAQEEVVNNFDIIQIFITLYRYLERQKDSVEKIVGKIAKLQVLNEYGTAILIDDSEVFQRVEDNHKQVLCYRSSLKHCLADMEDAEEQDDKEKVDEICTKISSIRDPLHEMLKSSGEIIDAEVEKLMIRKPELQLKNQSIFFGNEGIPIFLWDSIFFEIPRSDSVSDFFTTKFAGETVAMRKLRLNSNNLQNVLCNITTYSKKIKQSNNTMISLLPVSFAFLSKSEKNSVYLIMPMFKSVNQLSKPFRNSVVAIVDLFKSLIDQLLDLWHSGFTYSEEDLANGMFVCNLSEDVDKMFLPLPLSSIMNRENMNHKCESVHVYFSKLGAILQESLSSCVEPVNIDSPVVKKLIDDLSNCNGVQEAERVFYELDQFIAENASLQDSSELLNELLDNKESDTAEVLSNGINNIISSPSSKSSSRDSSITEKVLEILSDVE